MSRGSQRRYNGMMKHSAYRSSFIPTFQYSILPILTTSLILCTVFGYSQPKLVVGIVVDQMRFDYIDKYWSKFGNDGFKRLVQEGYNCRNMNYNYVPTFTGPGHASIYTGTTPSVHGIVNNEWINRDNFKKWYCVYDSTQNGVGGKAGQMSPKNLVTSTVGEELKKINSASKVIGIALKDRGAILPAGHNATAAYWYDASNGCWITSTYYMKELPVWVNEFNKKEWPKQYLTRTWAPFLPDPEYAVRDVRDTACENSFKGKPHATFPYVLPELTKLNGELGLIRSTPFGNTFTKDFAIETIKNEKMGRGDVPDFLCVSFSSTDYIGHQFGPQSVEVEDCYIRFDKDLADLLKFLDGWVGKNNVLIFLTADHGASDAVNCIADKTVGGVVHEKVISDQLKKDLFAHFHDSVPLIVNDFDIYLDSTQIVRKNLNIDSVRDAVRDYIGEVNGIAEVAPPQLISRNRISYWQMSAAGFYPRRSGDMSFILKPYWLQGYPKGTSHGSPYEYDTHVPMVWWGYNVTPGNSEDKLTITQIAPTVSKLLKVPVPSGCKANPIAPLVK